jgi:hypothetical protein
MMRTIYVEVADISVYQQKAESFHPSRFAAACLPGSVGLLQRKR